MKLNYFKDKLFDLLNDSDEMRITDLDADDRNNLLTVWTKDGDIFEISIKRLFQPENNRSIMEPKIKAWQNPIQNHR